MSSMAVFESTLVIFPRSMMILKSPEVITCQILRNTIFLRKCAIILEPFIDSRPRKRHLIYLEGVSCWDIVRTGHTSLYYALEANNRQSSFFFAKTGVSNICFEQKNIRKRNLNTVVFSLSKHVEANAC